MAVEFSPDDPGSWDSVPDLEPSKPKKAPRKRKAKATPSVADDIDRMGKDSTPDEKGAGQQFTVLQGATTLMDVMSTVHDSRGNVCCGDTYRRQKMPVAMALNELAKDSPMLQSWITHGKAFKVIALMVALEPIGEHQWRGHLQPSLIARREAAQKAYDDSMLFQEGGGVVERDTRPGFTDEFTDLDGEGFEVHPDTAYRSTTVGE